MSESHQSMLQEIFTKFDMVEQRMAIIKKYAKHRPSDQLSMSAPQTCPVAMWVTAKPESVVTKSPFSKELLTI